MKPTILQRLLFFIILLGALALGVIVASGFLILALLLVPVVLLRFYLFKRTLKKTMATQRSSKNPDQSKPSSSGTVIEGEVVKKSDSDP